MLKKISYTIHVFCHTMDRKKEGHCIMVTIKDVAKAAGVSIATVSNYLNNTNPVRKSTAGRIKQAIEELGYKQNSLAKNLKSQKYTDIGIILPNFDDPYYVQIFQGIELVFQQSSYFLNLAFSYDQPERETHIIEGFLKKQVCGLIVIPSMTDSWKFYYDAYVSKNKPMVVLDREIDNLETSFISFDNEKTMSFLTRKLLEQKRCRLVLITGPEEFRCEQQCIAGFLRAHEESGTAVHAESQIISSGISKEEAFRVTTDLFKRTMPDAIITTSENSATGVIESMTLLGHALSDIPVITLGEEHWNKNTHSIASLSTIRPAIHMGELAASLLLEQIKAPIVSENRRIVLEDKILTEEGMAHPFFGETKAPVMQQGKSLQVMLLDTSQVHALTGLLKNFTMQTGIAIRTKIVPHHELYGRIMEEQGADSSDVFMFDVPWLYSLADSGVLADISQYVRKPFLNPGMFLPGCFDYFSEFEGRYYGLPFMYAPQILYYRRDLFEHAGLKNEFERIFHSSLRPPQTWKEFNAICEFFTEYTDAIAYGTSVPAAYPECLAPELYMRIFSSGGNVFDRKNKVVLNSAQNLKAYIDLVKVIKLAKPSFASTDDVEVVREFLRGETAMLISYPSFLNNAVDLRKPSKVLGRIGFSQIPGHTPILGGWSFGISSQSKKLEDAFEFIKWACTNQISDYFSLLGGFSAVESTYVNDELVKLYPWFPLYHSAYKRTKPILPPRKANGEIVSQNLIDDIICKGLYELIEDASNIPAVLEKTQEELEKLLQ